VFRLPLHPRLRCIFDGSHPLTRSYEIPKSSSVAPARYPAGQILSYFKAKAQAEDPRTTDYIRQVCLLFYFQPNPAAGKPVPCFRGKRSINA